MTYVFFTVESYQFPLAKHIKDEGNEVILAMVNNKNDLELGDKKEDEKIKEFRLSVYNGLIEKRDSKEVLKFLETVKNKDDYFIFFDYNDMYKISEKVLKMGFRKGLFPTALYYRLESERMFGKKLAEEHFKNVKIAPYKEFKKVADGIKYIQESKKKLVLKSNGKGGDTIVPKVKDLELSKQQLIFMLTKKAKDYEVEGFVLEEYIDNCLEVAPVMLFWNGEPVYSLVEFEQKELGAGNIGNLKGGNLAVNMRTELDCKLNQIAFPPIIHKMAKQQPGLAIYDAGLLWNGEEFYFTEFCGMRYGYDGLYAEIVMGDKGKPFVTAYFENIMNNKSPLLNKYGVSVRLFNFECHTHGMDMSVSDVPVNYEEEVENNLFLYRVKKVKDELLSVGEQDMLAVMTAADDDLNTAADKCYERVSKFYFEKLYYRIESDMLATDYKTSILNRMKAIEQFV